MTTIGLIGAGHIGSQIARLAVANGYEVVLSNPRGPDTLAPLVAELGPKARAGTTAEAAKAGDIVVVTWTNATDANAAKMHRLLRTLIQWVRPCLE